MRRRQGRVVFTGDFLRPQDLAFAPSQTENIRWFHRLFRRRVATATGLPVDWLAWDRGIDAGALYALWGAETDTSGWAAIFASDAIPAGVLEALDEAFGDAAVVVGFEMTECVKRALTHLGIPFLDFCIHPVRFLPDVFFAVQTNHPEVFAALLRHHEPEHRFYDWADLISAGAVKVKPRPELSAPSLVVGQTRADRSLIRDGRLTTLADFAPALRALARRHGVLMYRPHPYDTSDFGLMRIGLPFRTLRPATANAYLLMAEEELEEVVGISSSLLTEARYFGKRARFLLGPSLDIAADADAARPGQHLSVVEAAFDTDFWREVLAPLVPTTAPDGHRFRPPPNTLRIALRNFWGFNEVTTDFVAELHAVRR